MSVNDPRTRRASEGGSMLVEFAIILPVLGALLIGMLSGGIAYSRKLSLTNGAREGARYGATLPVQAGQSLNTWLDQVNTVAVGAVDDGLPSDAEGRYVCVAYVHPSGVISNDSNTSRVETGGTVSYGTGTSGKCFNDGRPAGERRIQVVVRRTTDLNALIYSRSLTIQGKSVARYEALSG